VSFKSIPSSDRWYGLLAMLGLLGVDILLIAGLRTRPVDGLTFILVLIVLGNLLALFYLGYRSFGALTLEYWVDRDGVTLVWGPTRQIVPMGMIRNVIQPPQVASADAPEPWHWPCPHRRRMHTDLFGPVNAYGTRPLSEQVVLVTDGECYAISPADPQGFLRALQERFALGANRILEPELRRPPIWTWELWRDRAALLLIGLGLLGLLVMFGALCFRYPELSADLPLHFDVTGIPDRISPKSELFMLPAIGLVVWLINTAAGIWLYRHVQRGAAYLFWLGALVVQGIAGLALFNLMRW
jgi:hypothetical protein